MYCDYNFGLRRAGADRGATDSLFDRHVTPKEGKKCVWNESPARVLPSCRMAVFVQMPHWAIINMRRLDMRAHLFQTPPAWL